MSIINLEPGTRFGRLTVVKVCRVEGKKKWECRCSCGATKFVFTSSLISGFTQSCGCLHKDRMKGTSYGIPLVNLTGEKFGRLTVKERIDTSGPTKWICLCECGNVKEVTSSNLKTGSVRSCGCLRKDAMSGVGSLNLMPNGEAHVNRILGNYKANATKRGLAWGLSKEEFRELIFSPCAYHGEPPTHVASKPSKPGSILCNGIDRIDSSLGYVQGNVLPCCWDCNRMKAALSLQEFKEHISNIYEHLHNMKSMKVGA